MVLKSETSSFISQPLLRQEVLKKLEELGIDTNALTVLSDEALNDLLYSLERLTNKHNIRSQNPLLHLSKNDKKMLNALLSSSGEISMVGLSRELQIPLSTLLRRRKRLEELLNRSYSINPEKFGLRTAKLFLSVDEPISFPAEELLSLPLITSVTRTIGDNSINFVIDVLFRTNSELLQTIEKIRSIKHVRSVSWSEILDIKTNNQQTLLDHFLGGGSNSD
jgi:DNA-binding Lrp family transcriptional regulator